MATEVEIVNRALIKIGEDTITALTDETKRARAADAIIDTVRQGTIRGYAWKFAIVRESKTSSFASPVFGYTDQYAFSPTWLRAFEAEGVWIGGGVLDQRAFKNETFAVEGRNVLANDAGPIGIRAVQDVTDESSFDPAFTEAFIDALAMELCDALSQSQEKREGVRRDWIQHMQAAIFSDAIEFPRNETPHSQWEKFLQIYVPGGTNRGS